MTAPRKSKREGYELPEIAADANGLVDALQPAESEGDPE